MRIAYAAEERTGVCNRRHRFSRNHQTKQVHARSREAAAVQERDIREVAADGAAGDCVFAGSLFDGFCRSRTARTEYACCSSPKVFTPARSDGEQRTRRQDQE